MKEQLQKIKSELIQDLDQCQDLNALGSLRSKYLGKSSQIATLMKTLKDIPVDQKPVIGSLIHQTKQELDEYITNKEADLKAIILNQKLQSEKIDVTIEKPFKEKGSIHPINLELQRLEKILTGMGFSQINGPEIDYDTYNFELVNVPKDHPARDMQDSLFITKDILLRTQTSNAQPRAMQNIKPPFKVFCAGRVFRKDEIDATHTPAFYQVEGIYIDKKVSMADLKSTITEILKEYLGEGTKTSFRSSYFPFTEPSVEVDAVCNICNGKGCPACKFVGGYEILGAGMIHPKVLEMNGIDSKKYSGYAFGFGFDRFPKMKYKIPYAKYMFEHDVRFLRQFK